MDLCCWCGKGYMIGDELLCQSWTGGEVDFFIDSMNVEGVGLKHGAWRDWANNCFVFFIWTIALYECLGWLSGVNAISQRPSEVFYSPVRIGVLLISKTWSDFFLKMAWHPSSHIWPTDIKEEFFSAAKTFISVAAGGSSKGKFSTCCGSIVLLSFSLTRGPMLVGWIMTDAWESAGVK